MRCPSCGGYEWNNGVCKYCGYMPQVFKPKFELGKIDLHKMAEGLAIKEGRIIFFSHSLTTYFTPVEKMCLELIRKKYPNYYIINPRDIALEHHMDFETCMKHILPEIQRCSILLYYKDDSDSPGVDMEIAEAKRLNIPTVELEIK